MIVEVYPEGKITTLTPVTLEISDFNDLPKVNIQSLGEVEVKKHLKGKLKAEFTLSLPGNYVVDIKNNNELIQKNILVHEQVFLNFNQEFGMFSILVFLTLLGVYLWMKKNHQ